MSAEINFDALQAILNRARELDAQMQRLFLDAGAITGDVQENGFTYDAVFNGGYTAKKLIRCVKGDAP